MQFQLKEYQKKVLDDLKNYLDCVSKNNSLKDSWKNYWENNGKTVGFGAIPSYKNEIAGVPSVCVKVPTGGGKTFLACAALQKIFDALPREHKFVIWLVPSDAIFTQTLNALKNTNHAYRQKIDEDFQSKVMVYDKEMLLLGQNFSPITVRENLSICVMTYASLRIDSKKQDERKVFQENGILKIFAEYFGKSELVLSDTPGSALINVLREFSPVVIIDESHNAKSDLSVEMLKKLNPSFILELTATPKTTSNIISYVKSRELKKENMVKLPIIVYKKNTRQEVLASAISMQKELEKIAVENEKNGGKYIRPIVLFQAQSKGKKDNATFEKIKEMLINFQIPKNQIAIKVSNNSKDLENVNLLSRDCPIRYIITINALKEGWDCPFAYILASLANKNSPTDITQIVGRILRQPHALEHDLGNLNLAYVLSCYQNFNDTLDKVVEGVKLAGFTKDECRQVLPKPTENFEQGTLELQNEEIADDFSDLKPENISETATATIKENVDNDLAAALEQEKNYTKENIELKTETQSKIREYFIESVANLKIPQFFTKTTPNLFGEEFVFLEKEHLSEGFNLSMQDTNIDLTVMPDDVFAVDISNDDTPKYRKIYGKERDQFVKFVNNLTEEKRLNLCIGKISSIIGKITNLSESQINLYVKKIIENMDAGKIETISSECESYALIISKKILALENEYRKKIFGSWLDAEKITCRNHFKLPESFEAAKTIDSIDKSLYTAEISDMNNFERQMIDNLSIFDNVKWWHRNISKKEFKVNAFVNHYPDFLVMLKSGKVLMIETKGDDRDNSDSKEKLELGRKWQNCAGANYKYFMVFENNKINADGAYNFNEFLNFVSEL